MPPSIGEPENDELASNFLLPDLLNIFNIRGDRQIRNVAMNGNLFLHPDVLLSIRDHKIGKARQLPNDPTVTNVQPIMF